MFSTKTDSLKLALGTCKVGAYWKTEYPQMCTNGLYYADIFCRIKVFEPIK